jgi:hypothetical protein
MIVRSHRLLPLLIGALCVARPHLALAADEAAPKPVEVKKVEDASKAEAASRFERGLKLFNAGDNAGALAEFKRIYEIMPNPVVLYNLGLVYAAMGRPVDSVDALEGAIASKSLSERDLARAEETLTEQKARVGRLLVTTVPEGAWIEIDNVQVAKTPLTAPLRVSQGTHIIGAVAEGFAPARKELVIAGNSEEKLHLELVPAQGKQIANLFVKTSTRGADVIVNGEVVGKTPLATTVALAPGRHVVELSRPGYVKLRREIELAQGATGELGMDLAVDQAALASEGATLVLDPSESPVELTVDGERKGVYTTPLRLPRGHHRLSVASAGFVPQELDVDLDPKKSNVVPVALEPTPETRERYESVASFHRTWGIIGMIGGVVIGGTGAVLSVIGGGNLEDAEAELAGLDQKLADSVPPCDWRNGFMAEDGTSTQCDTARANAQQDIDGAKTLRAVGYVGIGVGAAVAVTGLVLVLTGDDPGRYERPRAPGANRRRPRFAVVDGPGEAGAALRMSF